ncbi:hypothetical protein AMTRI_Chr10g231200 [Amborella trichopoda]|uniref:Protein LTV1 homolog n=1 Tax=Amborella trichopoda TaxID=13333 RepID=W1PD64_AMBTC|nr:protein LTV1 homolog [Amborella trichopoda]ERN05893.1 hypothetical protein AMTR_s00006p00266620 [Amborella trichopoda]|eukprot:XP_006844218.1 protein LTV1 homolog [Amborella trichopoda]
MGRKKKSFVDKKKSATFCLLARDSSEPASEAQASSDRVFVRVDNNPYCVDGFSEEDCFASNNQNQEPVDESIFADADEDDDSDEEVAEILGNPRIGGFESSFSSGPLRDHIRREILELGFPDDGYNYLQHLREIKQSGGGSAFYENSKAKLDQVRLDVKAYDASKLQIKSEASEDLYRVASKTYGVRVQKVVHPEVVALLNDSDGSQFGSDVEDLEEDFVVQANLADEGDDEQSEDVGGSRSLKVRDNDTLSPLKKAGVSDDHDDQPVSSGFKGVSGVGNEEEVRLRRPLDEQFDLMMLREYDNNSEDFEGHDYASEDDDPLASKLNNALKCHPVDELDLLDKYRVPADFIHPKHPDKIEEYPSNSLVEVIRKCSEYAEKYNVEGEEEGVMEIKESSDESEVWDCESVISTYSNLDNHPAKIGSPEKPRKKLSELVSRKQDIKSPLISLGGKEKLPVEFLPLGKKMDSAGEVKSGGQEKRGRVRFGETKEEKKERKTAIKGERREARRAKKELKCVYRGEAQRAQQVAAVSGPSSIHLA